MARSNGLAWIAIVILAVLPLNAADRIVDIHVHYNEEAPGYFAELLKIAEPLNLTACVLTRYRYRTIVAEAAKKHPMRIIPIGNVNLDDPNAVQEVKDFHALGYRGLGELEFPQKPYIDPSYFPVYRLANEYHWVVLFHTGIVLRRKFDEPENVASYRMRAAYLDEIARRFPNITVIGAHCGNPEYQWAAEVARWNPNVFFDLSGTTLTKFRGRLSEFRNIFWWSDTHEGEKQPDNNPSAFSKLVFGSDVAAHTLHLINHVLQQYRDFFAANDIPADTQQLILGGTLCEILGLPKQ